MRRLMTLLILAAVAVPAAAQETPRAPRPPRQPRPPRDSAVERGYRYDIGPEGITLQIGRRGRLGVVVNLGADPARDTIGAWITAVTPGGAADKAGVRTGDIVVTLNGKRLASADSAEDEESDRPGRRLVEMASRLHTGDTVRLELRRDGRPVSVTLVAGPSGMEDMVRTFRIPTTPRALTLPFEGGAMSFAFSGAPLANLELVKVNPGLADYFGTSEGVLVVNAPGDSSLGLRAGDVILAIGGRKPSSPSHAFRILGTYDPGESVSFELMRMKRTIRVTGKMPERHGWRVMPNSYFDFDEPMEPQWDQMNWLRDWSGMDLLRQLPGTSHTPLLREFPMPDLQLLKQLPERTVKLAPRHQVVAT